jgi:hypothetical protein
LDSSFATYEKSFFSLLLMMRCNKLERLSLETLSSHVI